MKLESLLKPIEWLDRDVLLRQYTKLGKKINIDEGRKKYFIGYGLDLTSCILNRAGKLVFTGTALISYSLLGMNDTFYNSQGMFGDFEEDDNSESIAVNRKKSFHQKYNSFVRLPTFLFGAGLVGKFGIDLVNSITNKTAIAPESYYALSSGLGYLSLASSMYLKETDPRLLKKVPMWKKVYNSIKKKINSLVPEPVPVFSEIDTPN